MSQVPSFEAFLQPVLEAVEKGGGSATNAEINEFVIQRLQLTEEDLNVVSDKGASRARKYMGWARTYLKKAGFLQNSSQGVWALTERGRTESMDPIEVRQLVNAQYRQRQTSLRNATEEEDESLEPETDETWRTQLLELLKTLPPDRFERLCQRILREAGFVEVEVTGRTGDGGIDGRGVLRLHHVVSFQVVFQCKRYKESVGAGAIRDFRGAMAGRTDKGLFLTTGVFTKAARDEATRDGVPPIDLIDGEALVELMKSLQLGVATRMVEAVEVVEAWFEQL